MRRLDRTLRTAVALLSLGGASHAAELQQLDLLVVVYTRSFSHTLGATELERVHEEVLEFVDFYRSAAGHAVDFRVSLLQIDRELALADVSEVAPGRYYLSRDDVEDELVALGMADRGFEEVIVLYAWNNANPEGASLAYGGGAVGPDGDFLGDAGYNSIGIFAWDPGRISQIMIHEVLHNLDDMFSMSGMPERFLNSDEMSRNMPMLLEELPGAFLPHYSDDQMLNYAERELANRATYPWWMQLVYYRWMLERTPAAAWSELSYGRRIPADSVPRAARPLYERIYLSRANDRIYFPVVSEGAATARMADSTILLPGRRYRHTDFDGSTVFEGAYHAGWLPLPADADDVRMASGGVTRVERLGMAEWCAPARVVSLVPVGDPEDASAAGDAGALIVEARAARFAERGPRVGDARLTVAAGDAELAARRLSPGRFQVDLSALERGSHTLRLEGSAPGHTFRPRSVRVERRLPWRLSADSQIVAGNGQPVAITVRLARDVGVAAAAVTARIGDRELDLDEMTNGRYSGVLPAGLGPGLDTVTVRARVGPTATLERRIPVYVEPRGWIEVPRRLEVSAGSDAVIEARVRDRMGSLVRGAGLPLAAVVGPRLVPLREDGEGGVYRARLQLPPGAHRVYVIGLSGRYERRVVPVIAR